MRRLKIGIRPQLILLVGFASLFSLLILAIVTGVYFSINLSSLRSERLQVISQLKANQVLQSIDYVYYQVYSLTSKDSLYGPLSSSRAGNSSNFGEARQAIEQLVWSSELFAAARLYDTELNMVADAYNSESPVSDSAMDYLFPLRNNSSIPSSLYDTDDGYPAYFTGPISNSSDTDNHYFMGITLPIYSNSSIILSDPSVAGYLSVISNAQNIQVAVNGTSTSLAHEDDDYHVVAVRPIFSDASNISSEVTGFQAIFPSAWNNLEPNVNYNINSSGSVKEAIARSSGSSSFAKSYGGYHVAIGFDRISIDSTLYWELIIEQKRSIFLQPVKKLRNIIIGVVIGIGAFMCLITFPLTVWFVRPITKLKDATEAITKSKKRAMSPEKSSNLTPPPPYGPSGSPSNETRNSTISVGSNTSAGYSTGIRLPSRIPRSKLFFKDEITELTEAFNIMTDELDKQYTHLEDRVKSRTKELEASKIEAESANEAKTVFIANISHELRTPLNGILGMTSIAMDEEDQSRIQDSLKLIHRSGELLLHILTELLTYSKNTLSRSKLEKSNFQILEVVYQVKSIFAKLATDQRVNFKILMRPDIIRKLILYGDSNRIIQIIMNLVSNSLKFTPVDGSVNVNFRLVGEYDYEKSKSEKFEKVHVLKNKENELNAKDGSNNSYPPHKLDDDDATNGVPTVSKSKANTTSLDPSSNIPSSLSISDRDNLSVATISSTEYENVLFKSQFKVKPNIKPLPNLPRNSSNDVSLQHNDLLHEDEEIASNKDDEVEKLDEKDSESPTNEKEMIEESNGTIKEMNSNAFESNGGISDPKDDSGRKRLSVSSFRSSMSGNELVKNNKAYNIRRLYKQKTWVFQIEVNDTGPGIEPALQEKVFEPFVQGDQTLSRSYGGTGLGLSICRQLAKMMKGTLTLKSTLGVGSKFTFTVPLPQTGEILVEDEDMAAFCEDEFNPNSKYNRKITFKNPESDDIADHEKDAKSDSSSSEHAKNEMHNSNGDGFYPKIEVKQVTNNDDKVKIHASIRDSKHLEIAEAKPQLATRSSTGTAASSTRGQEHSDISIMENLSHLKILVAEDNMVNQEVIKRMLKLEGFENITMACNGAESVELIKESIENEEQFDLVFMDVQMPKIDGLLATKMIRNNLQYNHPVIALTAFADESNVKECLSCGMSGFLAKPVKRTNLRKVIAEFSPTLLKEIVTTPQAKLHDDKRLGYDDINE
ncbi:uncharacterized protein PRCAT00006313001 [Priceomyces carsonii]|uniref:uncharacterized protein n=1 Tax=Priceomyces carsonii TaxID=28549 RepID=UPI002EDADFDA|nr:unnamed protein product [Priceomyces carsonii]